MKKYNVFAHGMYSSYVPQKSLHGLNMALLTLAVIAIGVAVELTIYYQPILNSIN